MCFKQRPLFIALVGCLLSVLPGGQPLESHQRRGAFIGYHEDGHSFQGIPYIVKFNSTYGMIRVKLRSDLAPKTVELVKRLAWVGACPVCKFYRHEPVPQGWGQNGLYGPPYALLQGSLAGMTEQPPMEGTPAVKKGDVCMIPHSREFFIATADHEEWGHAHTGWGQVADDASWLVIERIPYEPFTTRTDAGNITTRWLTQEATVPFSLGLEQQPMVLKPA